MRIVHLRWIAAACLVASAAPAVAQVTPEERRACGPDAMRLCREFVPDPKKVEACLTEKQADISEACRAVMAAAAAQKAAAPPSEATAPPATKQATAKTTVKRKTARKATAKKRAAGKTMIHPRKKAKKKRKAVSVKG